MVLIGALSFSMSGCIYLAVGGLGAIGGYVISPDTVEGVTENDRMLVWDSAVEVLSIMGVIEEQVEGSGRLIANITGTKVTVYLIPINDTTLKVQVKARKLRMPRIATAQEVLFKIMTNVNE